jgi:hypothetical protein
MVSAVPPLFSGEVALESTQDEFLHVRHPVAAANADRGEPTAKNYRAVRFLCCCPTLSLLHTDGECSQTFGGIELCLGTRLPEL